MTPERYYYLKFKKIFDLKIKKKFGIVLLVLVLFWVQGILFHPIFAGLAIITMFLLLCIINGVRDEIVHELKSKDEQVK